MWISETLSFLQGFAWENHEVESFRVQEEFAVLHRGVVHGPRGRDSFYFGLFSILGAVWLSFNAIRGCLAFFFSLRGCLAK